MFPFLKKEGLFIFFILLLIYELVLSPFMKGAVGRVYGFPNKVVEDKSIRNISIPTIKPITPNMADIIIKKYQRRRDGFNHVTVMFKKTAVLKAGNYQSCLLMEDTYLWANMFMSGANSKNIDDYLVYARVGSDMFERRGGWSYYKKYKQGRKQVYKTGFISWWDYRHTLNIQLVVALMPNKLRGLVFKKMLHKKGGKKKWLKK